MTREEIVAFFDRRQEALARLDVRALADLHTADGVLESAMAGTATGRKGIEDFYRGLFAAFPDFRYEPDELVIDGDRIVQTATFEGTNMGAFMGIAPTAKQVRIPGVFLFTLRDHQIVRLRSVYDFTGLLLQVGVLKVKLC